MQWQLCCSEKAAWVAEGRLQDGAGGALVREGGQVTCEEAQEKWWFIADGDDNGDHFHASSDDGGGKSDNGDEEQNYFDANSEVKKEYSKKLKNWKPLGFKLCQQLSVFVNCLSTNWYGFHGHRLKSLLGRSISQSLLYNPENNHQLLAQMILEQILLTFKKFDVINSG